MFRSEGGPEKALRWRSPISKARGGKTLENTSISGAGVAEMHDNTNNIAAEAAAQSTPRLRGVARRHARSNPWGGRGGSPDLLTPVSPKY